MSPGTRATPLAGMSFAHLDLDAATRLLLSPQGLRTGVPWRLVNTWSIALAHRQRGYASVLRGDGVNLADGKPVAWVLRALGRRHGSSTVAAQVRGPDFFPHVLDVGRRAAVRHYLLGGTAETLERLQTVIAERFPGCRVVGAEAPPFRPLTHDERAAQDERIRSSGADVVWVGLGTPKQDIEAQRLAAALDRPVVAVGAAFDFLAGTKSEAPRWVQRAALEWLFRFASEPGRLWRRYTLGLLFFARVALRDLRRPVVRSLPVGSLRRPQPGMRLAEEFAVERVGA
ncbi:WecB/TagA/CpsF family glycosyltransferase [Petropleomorpha daqingensis]|uniref:N-acetylglucosaminyldiphosphoundecaprenol N-acetyl-beta-D-mannosaminyltransferase n=1 Tax=Petropleomorpha daqingensis TaxID=2026353 RepID=A0A853CFV5_9ACTN|nr:WecB/TagA/CpsF family glycosyltransferase [Petropleomorpha daqingensis]NYJ05879.1 N-acetylglucosaminyldiphosphoundecaprenol N-acetyl-beta-D-mannosaminyltransferase [Petropleomorpha daqingensis]